jgi:hypothetical protein
MRKNSVWFFCLAAMSMGLLGVLSEAWAAGGLHYAADEIGKESMA